MKNPSLSVLSILLLLTVLSGDAVADTTAHVNPNLRYGVWQGWGVSLAWWANVVGGFPETARRDYIAKAFDEKTGLGMNVVRYNIGGGENPADLPPHPSAMQYRTRVPGYEPSPGHWDWSADANQRWVLTRAIGMGVDQLEAFSNSPPYWMTASGSVTGAKDGADNLPPANDAEFAGYLTAVVKHFRDKWGVTFRDLEPLNEPSGTWWKYGNYQEGCHVDPAHQARLIKTLAASMKRAGVSKKTSLTASDESDLDDAAATLGAYDAQTLADLSKINSHDYGGGDRARLAGLLRSAGKEFWLSEYGDGDASGLTMSRHILDDVRQLHPTAWCYWQLVDSAAGWGFLTNPLEGETTTAYTINEKYYVMGQYSRFIRPGFTIIDIDDPNSLAAYSPKTKTLVIVATNDVGAPNRVTFDLSRFRTTAQAVTTTRTSGTEQWATMPSLPIQGSGFTDAESAGSVTTYVVTGTTPL